MKDVNVFQFYSFELMLISNLNFSFVFVLLLQVIFEAKKVKEMS